MLNEHTLRSGLLMLGCLIAMLSDKAFADDSNDLNRDLVKVAAVQISGYDKGDLPREGYDPAAQLIPYIDRAGKDEAQLVVFPEYVLGHIKVPGQETERISAAAKASSIYVVVGCWEGLADGKFANSALIFDRSGTIIGKYNKTYCTCIRQAGILCFWCDQSETDSCCSLHQPKLRTTSAGSLRRSGDTEANANQRRSSPDRKVDDEPCRQE